MIAIWERNTPSAASSSASSMTISPIVISVLV